MFVDDLKVPDLNVRVLEGQLDRLETIGTRVRFAWVCELHDEGPSPTQHPHVDVFAARPVQRSAVRLEVVFCLLINYAFNRAMPSRFAVDAPGRLAALAR